MRGWIASVNAVIALKSTPRMPRVLLLPSRLPFITYHTTTPVTARSARMTGKIHGGTIMSSLPDRSGLGRRHFERHLAAAAQQRELYRASDLVVGQQAMQVVDA